MKWLIFVAGVLSLISIICMCITIFMPTPPPVSTARWDEETKDGWVFVGRTPEGQAIKKKYFQEHGVWIFATYSHNESISAVPLEILERTAAGDHYKQESHDKK